MAVITKNYPKLKKWVAERSRSSHFWAFRLRSTTKNKVSLIISDFSNNATKQANALLLRHFHLRCNRILPQSE